MQTYLENAVSGRVPLNHTILSQLQDIFNLAPNIDPQELAKSFAMKTNDLMVVIYLSSLIRSIIALHSLINNKLDNRNAERTAAQAAENKAVAVATSKDSKDSKDAKSETTKETK